MPITPDHFLKLVTQHAEGLKPNGNAMACSVGACNDISDSPIRLDDGKGAGYTGGGPRNRGHNGPGIG